MSETIARSEDAAADAGAVTTRPTAAVADAVAPPARSSDCCRWSSRWSSGSCSAASPRPTTPRRRSGGPRCKPLWSDGSLLAAIGDTARTLVLSIVVAAVVGALVGLAVGSSRGVDRALSPLIEFLRVLPAAALVPLAALVLGYTLQMKIAVVLLPTTWPILLACRSARRAVSPVLVDASRSLGLSRAERFRKILLPSLAPAVVLGLRVAAPLALIITVLVEIVTRVNGIGALMGEAQANFRSAEVYGLLLLAGIIGFLINVIVTVLEGLVRRRMAGE